ncbi:MAG: hypothetical protein JXA98_03725, partial [Methanosarcinaceae archaeon]|nr:hypothetical protein [Methanosarcinaceae archaeon]
SRCLRGMCGDYRMNHTTAAHSTTELRRVNYQIQAYRIQAHCPNDVPTLIRTIILILFAVKV